MAFPPVSKCKPYLKLALFY